MGLYRVAGTDAAGNIFKTRFEAPSPGELETFLAGEGVTLNEIKPVRLTAGPYSRLPWLIFIWPIFLVVLLQCIISLVREITSYSERGVSSIVMLLLVAASMALLVYNILWRIGSMYDMAGGIREYAKGQSITLASDANEEEQDEDDADEAFDELSEPDR